MAELERVGVRVVDLAVPGRADRSVRQLGRAVWRFRTILRQPDVQQVDSALFEADLVARLAMLRRATPLVTHLVNTTYDPAARHASRRRGAWRGALVRLVDSMTARRVDVFVALTLAVKESAARRLHLDPRRIRVIPRGVDTKRFSPGPLGRRDKLGPEPLRLLTVGRLVPQKNHLTLVEAINEVQDMHLTIVGEGHLEEDIRESLARLGLEDRISLVGPTREMTDLYRSYDAFVLASLHEGQSNALLEAMSSALPIVASDIPVLREVVGSRGIFVNPADKRSIAAGLLHLEDLFLQGRAREVGSALRGRVESLYQAETTTRALEDLYDELVSRPGVSGS